MFNRTPVKIDPTAKPADAPATDPARQAIATAMETAQPMPAREPTPAEKATAFGNQVRERTANATSKDGMPAPRRQASAARLQMAQSGFRVWDYVTEFGTAFEDLLEPGYWAHVARKLMTWDQITVRAEEGSFYAEVIVTEVGQLFAYVVAKPGYPLQLQVAEPDTDASIPVGHSVKWLGEHKKYGAMRGNDCIKDGFSNKGAAVVWLQNIARARA